MERRQLEFFIAIADAGSFTRAAARLHVAQPSLSYAIRGLEKELGAELFERLGRGVRLTASGAALIGPARRTIRSFELAAGVVRSVSEVGFGRLTIVSSTIWAVDPLARILGEFRRVQPRVQVTVVDPRQRADVVEQVRSGEADLGLLEGPAPEGVFGSQFLVEHELVAVLPPGTPHDDPTVTIAALAERGLVTTPAGTALRGLLDERLDIAGLPRDVAIETAHAASVVPLVLAGAGAAVLTQGLANAALAQGAHVVTLEPRARARVSLVWREGRLSALGDQLVAIAQELFGAAAPMP